MPDKHYDAVQGGLVCNERQGIELGDVCLFGWLVSCLLACLLGCLVGFLVAWLVIRLFVWLVGWVAWVDWLVGLHFTVKVLEMSVTSGTE